MTISARDSAYRDAAFGAVPLLPVHRSDVAPPDRPDMMMLPAVFHGFRLPTLDGARPVVVRNWHRTGRSTGRQHVVVMDNDPCLLEVLGNLLDDEGYDVTLSP